MRISFKLLLKKTDWEDWVRQVRVHDPKLATPGRRPPRVIFSFGGAGFLVTYSLGVAKFLQEQKKELLAQSYLVGAGSGVIPAIALACGPNTVNIEQIAVEIAKLKFNPRNEKKRRQLTYSLLDKYLPKDEVAGIQKDDSGVSGIATTINGRVSISIGIPPNDVNYLRQPKKKAMYGHCISFFDSREDVINCMIAAMCCNQKSPCSLRDCNENVTTSTFWSMSAQIDDVIKHVYVHGFANNQHRLKKSGHNIFLGKDGLVVNTSMSVWHQAILACAPWIPGLGGHKRLLEAFERGYKDAEVYERWDDDPYFHAKVLMNEGEQSYRLKQFIDGIIGRDSDIFEL